MVPRRTQPPILRSILTHSDPDFPGGSSFQDARPAREQPPHALSQPRASDATLTKEARCACTQETHRCIGTGTLHAQIDFTPTIAFCGCKAIDDIDTIAFATRVLGVCCFDRPSTELLTPGLLSGLGLRLVPYCSCVRVRVMQTRLWEISPRHGPANSKLVCPVHTLIRIN
jgi:hypothetical protein